MADAVDRLSCLLERFQVRAHLSRPGAPRSGMTQPQTNISGKVNSGKASRYLRREFSAAAGVGYLHVLRRGDLTVTHTRGDLPKKLMLREPALLFYPLPLTHHFALDDGDMSRLTCAEIEFDGGGGNPLARALPPLITLPLNTVDGLEPALNLLFAETDRVRCGQRLLADRLFEVVLIQLLRWLLDNHAMADIRPGLITGLSHGKIARALVALHESPGAAWNLEKLAQAAGMSRSQFANVFREVVGQTPMEYVTDWRITIAQKALRQGKPLAHIAQELGYASASSLSRVFASQVGLPPRAWANKK